MANARDVFNQSIDNAKLSISPAFSVQRDEDAMVRLFFNLHPDAEISDWMPSLYYRIYSDDQEVRRRAINEWAAMTTPPPRRVWSLKP